MKGRRFRRCCATLFGLSVSSLKKSQGFKEFAKAILQGVAFARCNTVFCSKNSFIDCISVCQCISSVWVDVIAFALAPRPRYPMDTPELLTVDQSIAQDFRTCVGPGPQHLQHSCQKLGKRDMQEG